MAGIHCALRSGVVSDLDKTEPPGLAGKTIVHQRYGIDLHAIGGKKIMQIRIGRRVGEISYEKFLHFSTPIRPYYAMARTMPSTGRSAARKPEAGGGI